QRDHDRLEAQRYRRGDVQMRRALNVGLPGDRKGDDDGMQRKDLQQRKHAVLVQQQEAHQHQPAGQEVGDVELQVCHQRASVTNISKVASRASISPAPRKTGTRNTRILATLLSKNASMKPARASLTINVPSWSKNGDCAAPSR